MTVLCAYTSRKNTRNVVLSLYGACFIAKIIWLSIIHSCIVSRTIIDFPRGAALVGIANSSDVFSGPKSRSEDGRRKRNCVTVTRAMRRGGWLRNNVCVCVWLTDWVCVCLWWAASAWKFSPPVAKQFPWKRSYGHGFRRINTARVGNNVPRARVPVRQFARREMRFPYENEEKTAFVDFAAKGTIGPWLH